jgi:hypothetical protein
MPFMQRYRPQVALAKEPNTWLLQMCISKSIHLGREE